MKIENFIEILSNKSDIQQIETVELKKVINKYPYFQVARSLYLKGLKNQDSFKYNKEVKITAAYTTDRTILFDYITSNDFNNKEANIHQQIESKITEDIQLEDKTNTEPKVIIEKQELAKEKLEIGKPISFDNKENYSFNQWLQISSKKPIKREGKNSDTKEIIKTFIDSNPKIKPLPKGKDITVSISKNEQDSSLMTETLAKVYLEQKKFENAIQAYRILSLKYPEKSGFFADQIKRIQILQKNK